MPDSRTPASERPTRLVVAIPTFDRPQRLLATVEKVFPHIGSECRLEIFDNASAKGVPPELLDLERQFPDRLRITRNPANIGLGANLTRCIEAVDAEWVWVLGDDDCPADTAIATILAKIEEHASACQINFASVWSGPRAATVGCKSVGELCQRSGSLSNILFVSTSVFHRERFLRHLSFAYAFNHSLGGFLAPSLLELSRRSSPVILEAAEIVAWQEAGVGGSWNGLAISLGVMSLLELPLGLDDREFSRMGRWIAAHTLNPRASLRSAMLDTPGQSAGYRKYIFRQLRARVADWAWTGFVDRLWWIFAGLLAWLPASWILRLIQWKLGSTLTAIRSGDRYQRI